jgi:hypothetical protein
MTLDNNYLFKIYEENNFLNKDNFNYYDFKNNIYKNDLFISSCKLNYNNEILTLEFINLEIIKIDKNIYYLQINDTTTLNNLLIIDNIINNELFQKLLSNNDFNENVLKYITNKEIINYNSILKKNNIIKIKISNNTKISVNNIPTSINELSIGDIIQCTTILNEFIFFPKESKYFINQVFLNINKIVNKNDNLLNNDLQDENDLINEFDLTNDNSLTNNDDSTNNENTINILTSEDDTTFDDDLTDNSTNEDNTTEDDLTDNSTDEDFLTNGDGSTNEDDLSDGELMDDNNLSGDNVENFIDNLLEDENVNENCNDMINVNNIVEKLLDDELVNEIKEVIKSDVVEELNNKNIILNNIKIEKNNCVCDICGFIGVSLRGLNMHKKKMHV